MQTALRRGVNPPIVSEDCPSIQSLDDVYTNIYNFLSQEFDARILGLTRQLHASSCDHILSSNPRSKSGLYWIRNGTEVIQQFCTFL